MRLVPIRVLLVDDDPLVRAGLRFLLDSADDLTVVGEAGDGDEVVAAVRASQPDVVLMDLRMPGGDGVAAIRSLRATSAARPRILVLTTYDTDHDIRTALAAGADGYLLKDTPRADLIRAVRDLAAGRPVLSAVALAALSGRGAVEVALTPREVDVVRELAAGGTNREAAARLHVSETTFKTHLSKVYEKLGVNDRAAAVRVAYERGLI